MGESKTRTKKNGEPDKRSIASKLNAKKARTQRLQKIYSQPKVEYEYETDDSSTESEIESEDEQIVIKTSKKGKGKAPKKVKRDSESDLRQEIETLKQMLAKKAKTKKPKKKTVKVLQTAPQSQTQQPTQEKKQNTEALKYLFTKF